ncbi:MAG: AAA family ATPase [Candidatus Methanomethylicia archaeon]|nr:AAA family ATPase [Candidatus Methanomethylicia archaeon]MCX8168920.1 AAA family ATPase [Candidatus Methanomethylicia archaeon]MDW7988652.1 AAA family ATPase [Nitrososphaerota archaeon]
MKRPFIASISGKGGTGKTTLTSLLLKVLLDKQTEDLILLVDADPAMNLHELLGVKIENSIADVVEEFRRSVDRPEVAIGFSKDTLLEYWVHKAIVECKGFDLLSMGRGEGEGCYCYINTVLTRILGKISRNYSVILMDMEAGLEHLSRRTDRYVDTLIVVVDPSIMSLKTAEKIKQIIKEVNIEVKQMYIVGNKLPISMNEKLYMWSKNIGYEIAGIIPEDNMILEYSIKGKSLLELPNENPAVKAVEKIAENIGLI